MADSLLSFTDFKEQLAYLEERGLDKFTIQKLGLTVRTETWLNEHGIKWTGLSRGIVWELRNFRGEHTGKIGARVWYKKGLVESQDRPKFLPPKGQVPGLYFSQLADWTSLEYGQRIFICESYLKADILALCGFHAIGISGVWGWSHNKQLNWDFGDVPWKDGGYIPTILFDTDVCPERPDLYQAARKLGNELRTRHGAPADIIVLPGYPKKLGVDDYFMIQGKFTLQSLCKGETAEPLPDAMTDQLKIMGTEVCYARDIHRFVEIDTGNIMTRGDFENADYANRIVWNDEEKPVYVAKAYTRWIDRTEVHEVVYRPGAERIRPGEYYNLWEGMGCTPVAADVAFFTSWVEAVFNQDDGNYFLDWWAWQLQNLGGKLTTSCVVVGAPGIGKGWITAIMEGIFGVKNISKIPLTVLERHFNADVAAKQLMIVEETDEVGKNSNLIYNKLKDMITSTTIRLEKKGMDAYLIENTVNCFLTGNQIGIFKLDSDDRRFAVLEAVAEGIANDQAYWEPRWEWLAEGGGASAIYAFLLNRDLARFNPHGMAPMTAAKRDMIDSTHDPMDLWIQNLMDDPESFLVSGHSEVDGCLMSAREFVWLYNEGRVSMLDIDKKMVMHMNRALRNARVPIYPKKIKPTGGIPTNYFQVRKLPEGSYTAASLVNDRLFWKRLEASAQGQVATDGPKVAKDEKW